MSPYQLVNNEGKTAFNLGNQNVMEIRAALAKFVQVEVKSCILGLGKMVESRSAWRCHTNNDRTGSLKTLETGFCGLTAVHYYCFRFVEQNLSST